MRVGFWIASSPCGLLAMTAVEMDSPLWRFSLAVYRGAGVQEECLAVQERFGVDVNVLMFCAYVAAVDGAALADADLADVTSAVAAWHEEAVRGLRRVRQQMKPWGVSRHPNPPPLAGEGREGASASEFAGVIEALRTNVKGAELEAEHIEQAMLWAWLRAHLSRLHRLDHRAALAANVRALLLGCGAGEADADGLRALPNFCAAALQIGADQTLATAGASR